jgi:hypothetical protein
VATNYGSIPGYVRDASTFIIPVYAPATIATMSTMSRRARYVVSTAPVNRGSYNERSRLSRAVRTVNTYPNVAVQERSRTAQNKRGFNQLPYAPLTTFAVSPTAAFSGTALINGTTPAFDSIVIVYDHETGMDAGRSAIDMVTGAYAVRGLVPGRRYRLEVQNRVYGTTIRTAQIGIITA